MTSNRPNIADLFSKSNASNIKNAKQLRLFQNLQWRQAYQHSDTYVYKVDDEKVDKSIDVRQIPNGELKGLGTGTFVWPAAHVLAKYFEKRFGNGGLKGKVVCDVGCGAGLNGFLTAYLGAKVILTDQSCIIPLLSENTETFIASFADHVVPEQLQILEYDWNAKKSPTEESIDIVIVSDCVLPKLYPIDILVEVSKLFTLLNSCRQYSFTGCRCSNKRYNYRIFLI
jgi:predicted nicotinamide N-methyase